jgi:hypothetical protein
MEGEITLRGGGESGNCRVSLLVYCTAPPWPSLPEKDSARNFHADPGQLAVQEKSPDRNTLRNRILERRQLRLTVRASESVSCEHNRLALRSKPTDDRRHTRGMWLHTSYECMADWRGAETRPCRRSATAVRLAGSLERLSTIAQ